MEKNKPYSEGYRHFDQLIWAVPAVAALLVSKFIPSADQASGGNLDSSTVMTLVGALVMLAVTFTVYRFRHHQNQLKWYERTVTVGPQSLLQFGINMTIAFLVWTAVKRLLAADEVASSFGWSIATMASAATIATVLTVVQEHRLSLIHDQIWTQQLSLSTDAEKTIGNGGS